MYIYIYMLPTLPGIEHSYEELPVATQIMQSSSDELSILVAIKHKM